jgi:hypothetical protein
VDHVSIVKGLPSRTAQKQQVKTRAECIASTKSVLEIPGSSPEPVVLVQRVLAATQGHDPSSK